MGNQFNGVTLEYKHLVNAVTKTENYGRKQTSVKGIDFMM